MQPTYVASWEQIRGIYMSKIGEFFPGVIREARRVRWLKLNDIISFTGVVLTIIALFSIYFVMADFIVISMLRALGIQV